MRTVHDVEAAFTTLADTAPDPEMLTSTVGPSRPKRALLAPAAAALATAAVVAGVLVATLPADDTSGPSGSGDGVAAIAAPGSDESVDPSFRYTATAPANFDGSPSYGIDRGGQVLKFGSAQVTLFYANPPKDPDEPPFMIDKVRDRVDQDVDGRTGFYGRLGEPYFDHSEKLYWQYAPGAWAQASAGDRAAELALAESVRPATTPLRVPVGLARTPAGAYLNITDQAGPRGSYEVFVPQGGQTGFTLRWSTRSSADDPDAITVDGRRWSIDDSDPTQPVATLRDSDVSVSIHANHGTSRAELLRILENLRFAPDLADRDTWLASVLP